MTDQKPSVGRIVHYYPINLDGPALGDPLPAIIGRVGPTTVGVNVFGPEGGSQFIPYVAFSETPAQGRWSWPPRV